MSEQTIVRDRTKNGNIDLLISQIFVDRVWPNIVSVQRVDDLFVREHPRMRLFRRLDLPHQQFADPSFADIPANR